MYYQQYAKEINEILDRMPWDDVRKTADVLRVAWMAGRQVFVMGNGGSASTASHVACDLGKNAAVAGQPRLRIMSLNDNMAHFSALANDDGYDNVFAEQLSNFVSPGDVVIAISTSGNSPNVLKAVELAKSAGAITIGWCGFEGGRLASLTDTSVTVPSHNIEHVEDIHLMLGHMVTGSLRMAMEHEKAGVGELRRPQPRSSRLASTSAGLPRTQVSPNGKNAYDYD